MYPPLDINQLNYVDTGLISKNDNNTPAHISNLNTMEIYDLFCVAENKKPLAGLDFSAYGRSKLKKCNLCLINKIIDYCNFKKMKMLHVRQNGGMYLKSVFFMPDNYKNALKLMYVLWYDKIESIKSDIMIGLLFGYKHENIIYFVKRNYNLEIFEYTINKIQKELDNLTITLEDLNKDHHIILLDSIKRI